MILQFTIFLIRMTSSSLIGNLENNSKDIFILGYDSNNDIRNSFPYICDDDDDDDSEPREVPMEDPLRLEPVCIELISDIDDDGDDDVCIVDGNSSTTCSIVEKDSEVTSSVGNLKNDVSKGVLSSKKGNKNLKIKKDLKKIYETDLMEKNHCNSTKEVGRPKKKLRECSDIENEKECQVESSSRVSNFFEEEQTNRTSDDSDDMKSRRGGRRKISSMKQKENEEKKQDQKSFMTSADSFFYCGNDMMKNNNFEPINIGSAPESETSDNTNSVINDEGISPFVANDIMLIAWELEIKKQEELRKGSGRSKPKQRSCDCRLVYKGLTDDHSYETKRRVNYLTKYTCCVFRKTVVGHVYYVPMITPKMNSSSKHKITSIKRKNKLKKKSSTSDEEEFEDNGKDLNDLDSFDKLIKLDL